MGLDYFQLFLMIAGFSLAMYSCVSNDVPQALGTFLSSNMKRSRLTIWAFAVSVLVITMSWGYFGGGGDMAFGRLERIPMVARLYWWHLIPPMVLLLLSWRGIPVSTTFMLLSVFSSSAVIGSMVMKSVAGYVIALFTAMFAYTVVSGGIERRWIATSGNGTPRKWVVMQWASTAFLWSQWIMQDAANILVYLPREASMLQFVLVVAAMSAFMWLVVANRGGRIQQIVMRKTNVMDMRSATIIDAIYGFILFFFLKWSNIPMSTTWIFLGLLAGREMALYYRLNLLPKSRMWRDIGRDLMKVLAGVLVSVAVVYGVLYIPRFEKLVLSLF